uniref:Large ribosomal subunit protein uL18m n=1 Tax=Gallus gallus TaxID=9031 RepID=A0A8V0XMK5_CHICK
RLLWDGAAAGKRGLEPWPGGGVSAAVLEVKSFRYSSATAGLKSVSDIDTRENEVVSPDFTNRNPRNLEQLALARKERGWKTTWPKREFWHRLRLERTQHYVEAFVERSNGNVVLSASTREWAIKKHLYSPTGVTACRNLGRVMAQRCLEAGINFVNFKAVIPWEHRCDSASTCLLIFNLPFFPFLNTDLCFCTISAFLCGLTVQRVTLTSYTLCVRGDIWVLTACSLFTSLSSHPDPGI